MSTQGSNVRSVSLDAGGELTIVGQITDLPTYDHKSSVLHVWLAQPECGKELGAGLAIDCFATESTEVKNDTASTVFKCNTFVLTVPLTDPTVPGVAGTFFQGPATVYVIAVLLPKNDKKVAHVLEWSRIAMLSEVRDPVVDTLPRKAKSA